MALTSFAAQNAKPKGKPYKLSDGSGLHMLVQPNGSKQALPLSLCRKRRHARGRIIPDCDACIYARQTVGAAKKFRDYAKSRAFTPQIAGGSTTQAFYTA